jgi:membrane-associated HD superfamily phosphohydrolase
MLVTISAQIFTGLTVLVIIFQICLAAGLPWGAASMGGKFPGKYPTKMRLVAIINIVILSLIAIIVLSRAGLILPKLLPFSKMTIWVVVLFYIAGTIMNTITPSKIERVWAPIALMQLVTSIMIALS